MKRVTPKGVVDESRESLVLLGEELKDPLVSILHQVELGHGSEAISTYARQAIHTIDALLLSQRFRNGQLRLELEPVHIGSAIQQVSNLMMPLMNTFKCTIRLDIQHGLEPVSADRRILVAAVISMWQGFLTTVDEGGEVIARAKRLKDGVRISLHSTETTLESIHFSKLNLNSTQPLQHKDGPSLDLITAARLFDVLGSSIGKSRHSFGAGIGATLPISKQMQMV